MRSFSPLLTPGDHEKASQWMCELRQQYSANSDIWHLRRDWKAIKNLFLSKLNEGIYPFSPLERYEFEDVIVSLWPSRDMVMLKLLNQALQQLMINDLPESCYHVKDHGGLKKAISHTHYDLSEHR